MIPCEIDCGCLQTDTVEVDVEGTLARYLEIESGRGKPSPGFAPMLRESGADLVIADTPPLAFPIAKAAGIPAWCLCNFTWLDIYAPYVAKHPALPGHVRAGCRPITPWPIGISASIPIWTASGHFPAGTSGAWPVEAVGMVCRPGRSRRGEFAKRFGLDPERKWCLIYVGSFGLDGVDWGAWRAIRIGNSWACIPLQGAPAELPVPAEGFELPVRRSERLLRSGARANWGMAWWPNAWPRPSRSCSWAGRDFAEFPMLKRVLEERGLGREIPLAEFMAMDIGEDLEALTSRPHLPLAATGVADILRKMGF